MKNQYPIRFRAVHTKNRWRKANHKSMQNALTGRRGATALFGHKNKVIDYSHEGEPMFVIIWHKGMEHEDIECGEIVMLDNNATDGLRRATISIKDIMAMEHSKCPPSDAELFRYFEMQQNSSSSVPQTKPAENTFLHFSQVEAQLELEVSASRELTSEARRARLAAANPIPHRIEVKTSAFIRNADVIVEVLTRAAGRCEACKEPAPFRRTSDGTPYLEVHHRRPLSNKGEDTVENALALCPNCHRRCHYGSTA